MNRKIKIILICAAALILNLLSVFVFRIVLHLPLFMDTIFTVAVTFWCGLVPGLAVSVVFNLLYPFVIHFLLGNELVLSPMLYAFCGAGIILTTWAIGHNKENFKISVSITALYLALISILSSLCTTFIGSIFDTLRWQDSDFSLFLRPFAEAFADQRFSLWVSCILAQIPISITDRTITTFAGYGVYKICAHFLGDDFTK